MSKVRDAHKLDTGVTDELFLADPDQWVYRRLTSGKPELIRREQAEDVTPEQFHLTVKEVFRPDQWQFAAPPQAYRDPRSPFFKRYDAASRVLNSDAAVEAALDAVAAECATLDFESTPLRRSEAASWKKFTIQRGTDVGWYLSQMGPGERETSFPTDVIAVIEHVAATYALARRLQHAPHGLPDPADTNAGFPTFVAHPLGKLAGYLLADINFNLTMENARAIARNLALPEEAALANGLGGRSGPLYKLKPLRRFTGVGWQDIGEWKGYSQRNRIVHMSSAAVNAKLRRLFDALHGARTAIPGLWHSGTLDWVNASRFTRLYESDISGFDTSVLRQLQTMVAFIFSRYMPDLMADWAFWEQAETLPMVGPSWSRTRGMCALNWFRGGTRSGLKTTAEAGTLYSLIACLLAMARQGYDITRWPYSDEFGVLVQGDDVLVSTRQPLDSDVWAAAYSDLGLKAELVDGDLFLSRHYTGADRPLPVAGRIVQQTLSNEHEPKGKAELVDGLLILGFIARSAGADRLPTDLRVAAGRCCSHAVWYQEYVPREHHHDIANARSALLNSSTAKEAITRSVDAAANAPWLIRQLRDAEHSPAAAALQAELARRGMQAVTGGGLDTTIENIRQKQAALSRTDRLRLATEYANAVLHDTEKANNVLFNLINAYARR